MTRLSDDAVLAIFRDLPGHQGCSEADLQAVESELNVIFPLVYRQMMLLDANRLVNSNFLIPLSQIAGYNRVDQDVQTPPELVAFTCPQVIFGIDDIRAVFALDADGRDDSAVYEFDHYHSSEESKPIQIHDSLNSFFADVLRGYLQL